MSKSTFASVPELFSKWVRGWVWDFLGYDQDSGWNDSFELTYKMRRKIVVIPFPARQEFKTKEYALEQAMSDARKWVAKNGLEKILELGKEVEIRVSLRDYPEAYSSLPFSALEINLGDPVQFTHTGDEGTICDAVFEGQESGYHKITYEVDRGDGLYFRTDVLGLAKI
jgi:hypothetical protein